MKNAARSIFLTVVVLLLIGACDEVNLLKIGSGGAKYEISRQITGPGAMLVGIQEDLRYIIVYNTGSEDVTDQFSWYISAGSTGSATVTLGTPVRVNPTGIGSVTIVADDGATMTGFPFEIINQVCVGHPGYAGTRDGSPARPFATIGAGITSAASKGLAGVRVENGIYSEAVTIQPNISLFGGYNSDFISRNVFGYGSQISAPSAAVTISIMTGVTSATMIEGFTINGGGATTGNTYGIMLASGGLRIVRNRIFGGNASGSNMSFGIDVGSSFPTTIECNEINGGSGERSMGINSANCPVLIRNNTIYGGTGVNSTRAIEFTGGGVVIRNNTIEGGISTFSIGIFVNGVNSTIQNNIIFSRSAGGYACYSGLTGYNPMYFQNNNVFASVLYYNGSAPLSTLFDLQTGLGAGTILDNISIDVYGYFSGVYHLPAGESFLAAVQNNGLDGLALGWGISLDKDGNVRTGNGSTGWTMGAYEVN